MISKLLKVLLVLPIIFSQVHADDSYQEFCASSWYDEIKYSQVGTTQLLDCFFSNVRFESVGLNAGYSRVKLTEVESLLRSDDTVSNNSVKLESYFGEVRDKSGTFDILSFFDFDRDELFSKNTYVEPLDINDSCKIIYVYGVSIEPFIFGLRLDNDLPVNVDGLKLYEYYSFYADLYPSDVLLLDEFDGFLNHFCSKDNSNSKLKRNFNEKWKKGVESIHS
ncbi:hypothetical protein [Pseudoalteromonas sp. T1lg76]|uniref:hypothetical protein n=1 Tax=Pseudoalteromonas sp. T1lg76 TaxID=2077103 RepID=UPI001319E58E|nr:hypothetical protein [Pseudoalteromonas sp. T1lg76]